jgi:hypothetical protein
MTASAQEHSRAAGSRPIHLPVRTGSARWAEQLPTPWCRLSATQSARLARHGWARTRSTHPAVTSGAAMPRARRSCAAGWSVTPQCSLAETAADRVRSCTPTRSRCVRPALGPCDRQHNRCRRPSGNRQGGPPRENHREHAPFRSFEPTRRPWRSSLATRGHSHRPPPVAPGKPAESVYSHLAGHLEPPCTIITSGAPRAVPLFLITLPSPGISCFVAAQRYPLANDASHAASRRSAPISPRN